MSLKTPIILGVAALLVAAFFWKVQTVPPARSSAPGPRGDSIPATPMAYRGLAIQLASGYKPLETYGPPLREMSEMGANTVLFSVAGHMEHARSQSIYIDARKAPAAEDLKQLIRLAHEHELKVIIMPIVLLNNPRGSEWRGVIEPPDWDDWWKQYEEFVLYFADIAREGGAVAMTIGSELVSTESHTDRWTTLIEKARKRFYGGLLGYSANWDHYRPVKFWDRLDFIGMTSYYTLADTDNPTIEQIVARWKPIRAEVLAWQRTVGKPILMTEVGWCSQEGAAKAPWNYYQNQKATPAGLEAQRRLYEAFIRAWDDVPELMGVIWWEWTPGPGGTGDFGYTPKNKPAERTLRRWFESHQQPPTATQPTSQCN